MTADGTTTSGGPAHGTGGRTAAFFDVDNTVVRGASSFHVGRAAQRRGMFRMRDLLRFAAHQIRFEIFGESKAGIELVRGRALSIVAGLSVAEVTTLAEEVYDEVLASRVFPGTKRLVDAHLAAGHEVWLVTATPLEIGELIARRLGATGALGTVAEHRDGVYTGRLVGSLLHGNAKAVAVRRLAEERGLDLGSCHAYSDSVNDLPLLGVVGHPCAINPDRSLRTRAREKGWPVREFRGTSRHARRGVHAASLAGAAWLAGLAMRAVRRSIVRA